MKKFFLLKMVAWLNRLGFVVVHADELHFAERQWTQLRRALPDLSFFGPDRLSRPFNQN